MDSQEEVISPRRGGYTSETCMDRTGSRNTTSRSSMRAVLLFLCGLLLRLRREVTLLQTRVLETGLTTVTGTVVSWVPCNRKGLRGHN